MEHLVSFERGYDCTKFECIASNPKCRPGSPGSHGKHGMNIRFVAKGDAGAVQFVLFTGWKPQYTRPDAIGHRRFDCHGTVAPADLGYHSKTPRYEGQDVTESSCEFCDDGPCYYAGSTLNASDAFYSLVNGGDAALWTFLEAYYRHVFEEVEYPTPAEYPKHPRYL